MAKVVQLLKFFLSSETAISTNSINIHNSTIKQKINTLCQLLAHVHCSLLFLVQFIFHNKFLMRCRGTNTVFNVTLLFEALKPGGLSRASQIFVLTWNRETKKYKTML